MTFDPQTKKREKAEDFIGWKSPDGKLKVIGIIEKSKNTTFKVTCTECSKDSELYPLGYFVSTKGNLKKGQKPCGCSNSPKWVDWQYLILVRRAVKDRFIVYGFSEEFNGKDTKLNLECLKDGHKWVASVDSIINGGRGCPKCSNKHRPTEQEALQKCIDICKEMSYDVVGFVDGYKNSKSRFEYVCKTHGKQNVSYDKFVNGGRRCGGCAKDENIRRLREDGNGNGYYPERKDETDFLYILNFSGKFIKVGRSFDVERRIPELQRASGIQGIIKLRIFTATHQEIYDYEQELHNELRERNFHHYVDWSNECFENDCKFILNKLLDQCGLQESSI